MKISTQLKFLKYLLGITLLSDHIDRHVVRLCQGFTQQQKIS